MQRSTCSKLILNGNFEPSLGKRVKYYIVSTLRKYETTRNRSYREVNTFKNWRTIFQLNLDGQKRSPSRQVNHPQAFKNCKSTGRLTRLVLALIFNGFEQ